MPAERRRAGLLSCLATLVGLLVAGCTPTAPPTVTPSATATPHDFTLGTSGPIHTADPAVALADTDVLIATSVFQRLMLVLPSTGELKPDAATDCLFTSPTLYECTLPKGLLFHNGHELTSSDVKFSVQRALRFATPGTAISMLTSLKRIDTPDPLTVRFQLSYADNQIGYGLASLSASLVDEQTFDPDTALPLASLPVGSGPYAVEVIDDTGVTFTRFPTYVGPLVGVLERIRLQRLADSVAGEAAISDGSLDMIWRTLEPAALQRVDDEHLRVHHRRLVEMDLHPLAQERPPLAFRRDAYGLRVDVRPRQEDPHAHALVVRYRQQLIDGCKTALAGERLASDVPNRRRPPPDASLFNPAAEADVGGFTSRPLHVAISPIIDSTDIHGLLECEFRLITQRGEDFNRLIWRNLKGDLAVIQLAFLKRIAEPGLQFFH